MVKQNDVNFPDENRIQRKKHSYKMQCVSRYLSILRLCLLEHHLHYEVEYVSCRTDVSYKQHKWC